VWDKYALTSGQTVRKRLLLLTQFFPPETAAGAHRIGAMAEVLSKHFEVSVVTLKPSYPSPQAYEGISLESHDARYSYGVKRTFAFNPHSGTLLLRSLREQIMTLRLALRALPESVDILLTSSPSMFLGPAGLAVARAKNAKFACDIRDVTWGYAKEVAGTSPTMIFAARMLERYILSALRRADLVIGASRGITTVVVEGGVDHDKAITVPNGISTDLLEAIMQGTAGKVENRRPVVAYAGLIGYNQDLGVLLEAARMVPDVDFILAGDGPELALLKKKAGELALDNVSFSGYLSRDKLIDLYRRSNVLFAHVRSSPTIDATMIPIKLFEYMATGKPIIYAGRGAAAELLRHIGCAVTVTPGDPKLIGTAISDLLRDPERMRMLGLRGRSRVQTDFHREKLMEKLACALEECFARGPDVR
jgi:colanic acid biosynthesis glycosyl transferase WcaI